MRHLITVLRVDGIALASHHLELNECVVKRYTLVFVRKQEEL